MAFPRLTFIAGTLGPGGVERQLFYCATALRALGVTPHVLSFSKGEFWEEKLRKAGIPVKCIGRRPLIPLRLHRIVAELKLNPPDFVQCSHFYTSPYGIAAARILGLKEIGSIRCDFGLEIGKPDALSGRLSARFLRRIIFNSKVAVRRALAFGIPPNRIHYMSNVVDTTIFSPAGKRSGQTVRLLTIGRFVAEKRYDRLLSIFASVVRRAPGKAVLTVLGEGPLRSRFEADAARLGLYPGSVFFRSQSDHVADAYRDADIFVLTSDHEGMPNVILEAMACGLPVIASSVGGIPELVLDGETGFLSPPWSEDAFVDRLLRLIDDPTLRLEMGARGREFIEARFSLKELPRQLFKLYEWADSL